MTRPPTFTELLANSVIVSGLLAIIVISTVCYIMATGVKVAPEMQTLLAAIVSSVVAYFFGQRGLSAAQRVADSSASTIASMSSEFSNQLRTLTLDSHEFSARQQAALVQNVITAIKAGNDVAAQKSNEPSQ